MNFRNHWLAAKALLLLPLVAGAQETPCPLEGLPDSLESAPECQFYLGTSAFRDQDYARAAEHWRRIVNGGSDDGGYRVEALGTLGYLTYHGLGVERDMAIAVGYWMQSVEKGGIEARFQLGNAYSDPEFAGYDPVRGLAWHRSLEIAYPNPEALGETDRSILQYAANAAADLRDELSAEDITRAEMLALELVDR